MPSHGSGLYEGCWHKLDRAREHVNTLNRGVATRDLDAHPPYGLRSEFRPDLDCLSVFFADVETPPTEWSLIIGDALTNFRAALDYCAHDLVGRGSRSNLKGTKDVRFVICRKEEALKGQIKGMLPGIQATHRTIVQRYQPCEDPPVEEHPFFLLDHLVNRDKHRQLVPLFSQHYGGLLRMRITKVRDFLPVRVERGEFYRRDPLPTHIEPGAEAMRAYGRVTGPNPQVTVTFDSTTSIAFEDGTPVGSTLDRIGVMITRLFLKLEPAL